jgi:hypothetical protein
VAYPRLRAAEKEASVVVVLKRQTPGVSIRWLRRQHPRRTQLHQTLDTSDGLTMDASVGRGHFWSSLNSVYWGQQTHGNEATTDAWTRGVHPSDGRGVPRLLQARQTRLVTLTSV